MSMSRVAPPSTRANPEIEQVLFVTRKTVETHLGAVYRKLAIPGRGDPVRALAQPT
jgi:DNA-binding CsgD family transcriptional regulator